MDYVTVTLGMMTLGLLVVLLVSAGHAYQSEQELHVADVRARAHLRASGYQYWKQSVKTRDGGQS